MATSTFRSISRPTTADERAVRVEDYLNDKLQTFADLENLDGLLKSVRDQQTILHKQVRSPLLVARNMSDIGQLSDAVTSESGSASSQAAHFHEYIQRIETFTRQQTNIDRRLLIVTRSEISDGAVRKFDETMARSQRLHTATDYIALLKQVDQLGYSTSPDSISLGLTDVSVSRASRRAKTFKTPHRLLYAHVSNCKTFQMRLSRHSQWQKAQLLT